MVIKENIIALAYFRFYGIKGDDKYTLRKILFSWNCGGTQPQTLSFIT